MVRLLELRIGRIEPFGPQGEPSAIAKQIFPGRLALGPHGLAYDHQADRQHHGGPDKALHHYPFEHYAAWRQELPGRADRFSQPGAFGENLVTTGLTEADVCLGDIFRLGSAVIQVSQGRQPCWKLNHRLDQPDMVARIRETGRTGWYYRVLEPGEIGIGDVFERIERPCPEWPLTRLWRTLFGTDLDAAALTTLSQHPLLAPSWRERALKRLAATTEPG